MQKFTGNFLGYVPKVTISHIRIPKLHTSDFGVKTLKYKDSGAIHLIGKAPWKKKKNEFWWKMKEIFLKFGFLPWSFAHTFHFQYLLDFGKDQNLKFCSTLYDQ